KWPNCCHGTWFLPINNRQYGAHLTLTTHITVKVIEFRPLLACRNKQHHQKNNGVRYGATKGTGGAAACNRKSRT
ncbi:hypothetical protein, partial [Citrobacter freundii]|uniref:hypothetical protein n=1 Tax=Citrobacter freundii TaxID=546 RepID=UPI0039B392B1